MKLLASNNIIFPVDIVNQGSNSNQLKIFMIAFPQLMVLRLSHIFPNVVWANLFPPNIICKGNVTVQFVTQLF